MIPRSTLPYATHVPVLIGLSRLMKVKSAIEFGSGFYSTKLFLDRKVFPDLGRLTSCENSKQWATDVESRVGEDDRHDWVMDDVVVPRDSIYDLALVDSDTEPNKIEDIRLCSQHRGGFTVIHDFEHVPYRIEVERKFQHWAEFKWLNPSTAVCWKGFCPVPVEGLFAIDGIICNYANVAPWDVAQWLEIFDKHKEQYESAWS